MWLAFKLRVTSSSVEKQGRGKGWRREGQREAGAGRQERDDSVFWNVERGPGCWQREPHGRENSCFTPRSGMWNEGTAVATESPTERENSCFTPVQTLMWWEKRNAVHCQASHSQVWAPFFLLPPSPLHFMQYTEISSPCTSITRLLITHLRVPDSIDTRRRVLARSKVHITYAYLI